MNAAASCRHVLRSLVEQTGRSALISLAMALASLMLIVVIGLSAGVSEQEQRLVASWEGRGIISAHGRHVVNPSGQVHELNSLTLEDLAALRGAFGSAVVFGGMVGRTMPVSSDDGSTSADVFGLEPSYLPVKGWRARTGRLLDDSDDHSLALRCAIGATVAEALFAGGNPVGRYVRVGRERVRVVGLLARRGPGAQDEDRDNVVLVPLSTARKRLFSVDGLRAIEFRPVRDEDPAALAPAMAELLRGRHGVRLNERDDFVLTTPDRIGRLYRSSFAGRLRLGAVLVTCAFALCGSMLGFVLSVSVTQRRAEIGLKRALGASRWAVFAEFLGESALLSTAGSALGILLGVAPVMLIPGLTRMTQHWSYWPMTITWQTVTIAMAFSIASGVLFGAYPARRAARIEPASALRGG